MTHQTDPWAHRETGYRPGEGDPATESLLALSNGYLGIRGTLDEEAPTATSGTYLNGFFETRPIPYADRGYADPEEDQVLIAVPDGTRLALQVESRPLDLRTGEVLDHERVLDFRAGMLARTLAWRSPDGHAVRVRSRRLVSLVHREIAVIDYRIEALETPLRIALDSHLLHAARPAAASDDPRAGVPLPAESLVPRSAVANADRSALVLTTHRSGRTVAAAVEHVLTGAAHDRVWCRATDSGVRWSLDTTIEPGAPMRLVKFLAYRWTAREGQADVLAAVHATLDGVVPAGFDGLAEAQRSALDEVWSTADIEVDGDPEVQHALRYALFQLHQNAACAAGHAIPAKGLTGPGYNGHTFWDTEIFLLPVLTHCAPRHATDALRWRASTLPQARAKARRLGLRGAAFPWRTIDGDECSGYLPAGTAAFHVNADIAHAVARHVESTGDERFEREIAAPLLIETARLWASLGYHDERRGGRFSIDGVTGPDEYSALVDNNFYTNIMAQANLREAARLVERMGAAALDVDEAEVAAWRRAADAMTLPFDSDLQIHLQDEDFARHERFDFEAMSPAHYPLFLHVPYFELYRRQVVKQPDLVLAMVLHPMGFSAEQRDRNLAYYEPLTVRDSSLSAGPMAVMAAAAGDPQLAYDYLAEAVLLDHHDIARNTADGLHLAALAGGWMAVIEGLGGLRRRSGQLRFAPRLPPGLRRVGFALSFRERSLYVDVGPDAASYHLRSGPPLEIHHFGEAVLLATGATARRPVPPAAPSVQLRQPPGRAPRRRKLPRAKA